MELKKRQPDSIGTITNVELRDDGGSFHGQTVMANYGVVRFSMNLEGALKGSGGFCHGSGQGSLNDGTFVSGTFYGRWRRKGTKIVCRHVVEVTNGDLNLDVVEWDTIGDTLSVACHILE